MNKIVIVGLGGIGSWVVQALCPYLAFSGKKWSLVLVDGDEYEEKNRSRQVFDELGFKAEVQTSWVARKYPQIAVSSITQYLSSGGEEDTYPISEAIHSGEIVFSCVDNHKTRKMIADHCSKLRDITLISGGNDYTDGNVQIFVRVAGENKTCSLEKYHEEIAQPRDKAPFELSCEDLASSSPQLIFANLMAATLMLNAFYAHEQKKLDWQKPEVYFDILANAATPRVRK